MKKTIVILFALLYFLGLSKLSWAPTVYGVLTGTVTDTDTGTKLGGVVIRSSRTPLTAISEPSGANMGTYEFPVHDTGSYTLTASVGGYTGVSGISFSVSKDTTTTTDFTMAKVCTDGDNDHYGNPGSSSCTNGSGTDCNDSNGAINPGAAEVCDYADNDCDGYINEGYIDTDGDGASDCVDADDDNEGIADGSDSCPLSKPARVVWYGGTYYASTLQEAYDWAEEGEELQCQNALIAGSVYIDDPLNKSVTFKGGYDCSYNVITGVTTINGNMVISKGKLTISSGTLKVQ